MTLPQVFSCEICKTFKDTFLYKTPLVTASGKCQNSVKNQLSWKYSVFEANQMLCSEYSYANVVSEILFLFCKSVLISSFVCFLFWLELTKQQFVATKYLPLTYLVLNRLTVPSPTVPSLNLFNKRY